MLKGKKIWQEREHWDPEVETMSRDQLEALQWKRLHLQLHYTYENSTLHRRIWDETGLCPDDIRSFEDFRDRAPFLYKDLVREERERSGDPFGGMLCLPLDQVVVQSSSGTTGVPTFVGFTEEDVEISTESWARIFWSQGVRPGDLYHVCIVNWHPAMPSIRKVADMMGLSVINTELNPLDIRRMVYTSHFLKPNVWLALPPPMISAVDEETARLRLDPREVFSSYKAILGGGDTITRKQKNMVREKWGTKLYEVAGIGELGFFPGECAVQDGQHVPEDLFLFEIVDADTGRPLSLTDRGEMVVTTLLNKGTPAVRWRSEDICYFKTERCQCGRTHARLFYLGRKGFIVKVKGRMVFPNEITLALEGIAGAEHGLFQIIKYAEEMEELQLRVGYFPEAMNKLEEMGRAITAAVEKNVGTKTKVNFVKAEELLAYGPPHKIPRIYKG